MVHGLRFVLMFAGIMIIGIGSSCFHGTLTHSGQQGDETPMVTPMVRKGEG